MTYRTSAARVSDLETESRRLDEHLRIKHEVVAVLQERNRLQKSARVSAVSGVIFGEVQAEYAILGAGQEPVAKSLPPGHSRLGWIQAEPPGTEHDVGLAFLDHSTQVGNDGGIVLPIRMQHHHNIGSHVERVAVARLLVAAVAKVSLVPDDIETQRCRHAHRRIGAGIVD